MEKIIELKNVTKRFGGITALNKASLYVNQGEVVGLIGDNGAGKSTLIKTLVGVYGPDEGEIKIRGQKVINGLDALILSKKLISLAKKKRSIKKKLNYSIITICFGGSDPKNYTYKIVNDIIKLNLNLNIKFKIIIGSLYNKESEKKLKDLTYNFKNFEIYRNPKNLYKIFFVVITSGSK